MSDRRPSKKSETLEVRLSLEAKLAFMAHCRERGRTASEIVRDLIERQLQSVETKKQPKSLHWRITAAAAAAGLALGAIAGPSLAHPIDRARAAFDRLDRNHDGVLTFQEFRDR